MNKLREHIIFSKKGLAIFFFISTAPIIQRGKIPVGASHNFCSIIALIRWIVVMALSYKDVNTPFTEETHNIP
jgi:hypothetical protein